jgi:membrane-associated protein
MLEWIRNAYHLVSDVQTIVEWGGPLLVCAIVFVETGLFVGFFLPGDSLLVTAGVFAAMGKINLAMLLGLVSLCAIAGDQVGYWIGRRAGDTLYRRDDSFFFRKKHLRRAHDFYEKHGAKTIILARFVPIVRTFAPVVAGAAAMHYRRFVTFNILGGILWVWSMVLIGYGLSSVIPGIDRHIHIVIAVVIFLSIIPPIVEILRNRRKEHAAP